MMLRKLWWRLTGRRWEEFKVVNPEFVRAGQPAVMPGGDCTVVIRVLGKRVLVLFDRKA